MKSKDMQLLLKKADMKMVVQLFRKQYQLVDELS